MQMEVNKLFLAGLCAAFVSLSAFGENFTLTDEPDTNLETGKMKAPGRRPRHLGMAVVADGGFEVTFFISGTHEVTITNEEGDVIFSATLSVEAGQSMFLSVPGVSEAEDTIDLYF